MTDTDHDGALGAVRATMLRGGTSRGLFLHADELPVDPGPTRDALVCELLGSPDPLQLNGVGGGKSHTSKVMLVGPTDRAGADLEYTFGQVSVTEAEVDWTRNNGNLASALGAFAVREGLVDAVEPRTEVTLYNTNTGTYVEQSVPVVDGAPAVYGDYHIDGVPGTGAPVETTFRDPGGAVTGALLPLGAPRSTFEVDGRELEVSVVDAGTLGVAMRAEDLGLTGTELPATLEGRTDVLATIEDLRGQIREALDLTEARRSNPSAAIVSAPQSYETSDGGRVDADDIDLTVRYVSLQPHHAASLTGSMTLTTSAMLPGTVPNGVADLRGQSTVTLGHPKGTLAIDVEVTDGDEPQVERVTYRRTICPVFRGEVYYRYLGPLTALRDA